MIFWEDIDPILTPDLTAAVEAAYQIFAPYKLNGIIIHCNCPVCMSEEVAAKLSRLPLKDITSELLAEYTNSAHGFDETIIEPEFKHFLPRYLELIAQCKPPSHIGLEMCLIRLEGYRQRYRPNEVKVINEFFNAYLKASLTQTGLIEWPVGLRLEFDLGEVLGMIICAGGDLEPALKQIDESPGLETALHLSALRQDLSLRHGEPLYQNAHLEGREQAATIGSWLNRKEVSERILQAAEENTNPDYDDILEMGMWEQ